MSHLSNYVEAILHPELACTHIIQKVETRTKQWIEDDTEVSQEISTYHFDNGAVIKRIIEQNHEAMMLDSCDDSWIIYMVIEQKKPAPVISPKRIQFNSACREAFWLRYFQDQVEKT